MTRWVMLLRGINVGGRHVLKMAALKALLEKRGGRDVATYIQSGNVVFSGPVDFSGPVYFSGPVDAPAFEEIVADEIERSHGFRPRVLVIAEADFREIVAGYPYPEAVDTPKTGHIWFLSGAARPDRSALAALAGATERFAITPRAFYLHAPDGIGRSKLATRVENLLGVPATARNLNTCAKLVAMLDAASMRR